MPPKEVITMATNKTFSGLNFMFLKECIKKTKSSKFSILYLLYIGQEILNLFM